ncbi:class I SAM-dependent DNA methyltransferase [Pontibacter sp. CAU 1760]
MDRYLETFATWNNIASLYQAKFMNLSLYDGTYDYICNAIAKPNAKLLDIGCGPGNITKYLLSKRPDFDIFGIDMAPNMVELARLNNPAAHFAVMDSRQIAKLGATYDGIICGFCLPYLSQSESATLITNTYNLLNGNGLLYISFVEGDPNTSGFKEGSGGRVYFYYHDLDGLKAQLSKNRFSEIETFTVRYKTSETGFEMHTILIAKKLSDL